MPTRVPREVEMSPAGKGVPAAPNEQGVKRQPAMKKALIVLGVLAGWALAAQARAQVQGDSAEAPAQGFSVPSLTERPARWGFNATLGAGGASGEFSSLLHRSISGDFGIF